jgi:hypothetical protein
MLANQPQVQIIDDTDHQTVVKITGYYNSATSSNTLVVQANTLYGANPNVPCILSVNSWEYSSSLANGFIVLEWVSLVNDNTTIMTTGRFNDGAVVRYARNNANTPTGDINLNTANAQPGDSFTITLSLVKEYQGQVLTVLAGNTYNYEGNVTSNNINYGVGAWARAQTGY